MLTPAEFHYALEDFEEIHFSPSHDICETLRLHGVYMYNSAFGRKKKDMIRNPKKLFRFSWEKDETQGVYENPDDVQVQSLDQMKDAVRSIAMQFGGGKKKKEK